ncbi:O-acetyl-ADP-ribose deacetylase macrod1 [Mortierella sp. NVP41]|nr:O-acetyl-ADP-ribose deacetylase macrod1 [Mortierella sp. NVP41]
MGKQQQRQDGITTLEDIPTLKECFDRFPRPAQADIYYAPNDLWNERISLWKGDITKLQIDAVVNAANESLLGGGGIDGAIHRAAGKELLEECRKLRGCPTGEAKSTKAYKLPSKRIIHTVGPIGEIPDRLKSCYRSVLEIVKNENLKSVAFCCISTGIYGYDNRKAANVALTTVRDWVNAHSKEAGGLIDRIVFCVFLDKDVQIYEQLLPRYFPKDEGDTKKKDTEASEGADHVSP